MDVQLPLGVLHPEDAGHERNDSARGKAEDMIVVMEGSASERYKIVFEREYSRADTSPV